MINAGGHIEKKPVSGENLDESEEGEKGGDPTSSIASSNSEESSRATSNDDSAIIDSAVPLMSEEEEEEEEGDIDVRNEAECIEKELSRRHKLRLFVSKGSVIIMSCAVLVVGVVIAAVLRYDYSSCELEELVDDLATVVSSAGAVYSTSGVTAMPRPLPTPTPTLN